jgi:hypothetical protein
VRSKGTHSYRPMKMVDILRDCRIQHDYLHLGGVAYGYYACQNCQKYYYYDDELDMQSSPNIPLKTLQVSCRSFQGMWVNQEEQAKKWANVDSLGDQIEEDSGKISSGDFYADWFPHTISSELVKIGVTTSFDVATTISDYLAICPLFEQSELLTKLLFNNNRSKCCIMVITGDDDNGDMLKYEDVDVDDDDEFIELLMNHKLLKFNRSNISLV